MARNSRQNSVRGPVRDPVSGCRRTVLLLASVVASVPLTTPARALPQDGLGPPVLSLETEHARLVIGTDGRTFRLIDARTGTDWRNESSGASWARARIGGVEQEATSVIEEPEPEEPPGSRSIRASFGGTGASATLRLRTEGSHFVIEVLSVDGPPVETLTFIDLPLGLQATPGEPFAACLLALDLRTNVAEIPGPATRLRATTYAKLGHAGARVALVACPPEVLREELKRAVEAAPDLPRTRVGGPWALDAPVNRGSYLFNFGGLSESNVDEWIAVVRKVGFDQIDFHGGSSFRFGDCRPNPETYPKGFESLRAVIDRLHAAGISAGLHTYAFFLDRSCPWVTPVPDPRLGKDASFTLAAPLDAEATRVVVREPTDAMSATTGFFVRNSATLMVGEELIVYAGVEKSPSSAFTGCRRGAWGTRAAAHPADAPVHHLKECFGLFAPDGDSTLLDEVAARTAEAYNRCGFDMIYMDALDGEDVLGGAEWGWHYGSKFVYEVARRLERPAVMEMSTFHHHLWCVRSRMGAWDHPTRSHKRFIDIHCAANEDLRRRFLPGQLGWWAVKTWSGAQGEPTHADDIEYLCAKALGNDTGLSLMGIDPRTIASVPAYERLARIFRDYEGLRRGPPLGDGLKARLREPGKEFSLVEEPGGKVGGRWSFRPVIHAKHRVEGPEEWTSVWNVENPFEPQAVTLRIEALLSAGPAAGPDARVVLDFEKSEAFVSRGSASGVELRLDAGSDASLPGPPGAGKEETDGPCGLLTATSRRAERRGSWAGTAREFSPPLDLARTQALGVWVRGDGKGEVLNFQLACPEHVVGALGEHYVVVDFSGWRWMELIEPEGERFEGYAWPYGNPYSIYRESIDFSQVKSIALWLNDVPPGETVVCAVGPVRALPCVPAVIRNPSIEVGGKTLRFPVDLETGSYLELRPPEECRVYGPGGALVRDVRPEGEIPVLERGENRIRFRCEGEDGIRRRARVTVTVRGAALEP